MLTGVSAHVLQRCRVLLSMRHDFSKFSRTAWTKGGHEPPMPPPPKSAPATGCPVSLMLLS